MSKINKYESDEKFKEFLEAFKSLDEENRERVYNSLTNDSIKNTFNVISDKLTYEQKMHILNYIRFVFPEYKDLIPEYHYLGSGKTLD